MAQSLKVSPFTTLGCPNTVLSDDFVHGSFETYKLKGTTTNGGKLDYKIKVNTTKKDGKFSAAVVDEGKVQFPLFDTLTLQLAQRRKGDLKILLDLGQFTFSGKQWNLFTAIKTETSLSNYQLNFGTNYFGPVCESNTRIELHPREAPILTHRNYIKRGSHYYGFATSLNLSTLALLRYDALIGYHNGDYDLSLKHESNSKNSKFDVLLFIQSSSLSISLLLLRFFSGSFLICFKNPIFILTITNQGNIF